MSKRRTSGKRLLKVQETPRWLEKLKSQRKTGRSASLLAEPLIVHGFFMILSNSSRVRRMHSVLQDYSSLLVPAIFEVCQTSPGRVLGGEVPGNSCALPRDWNDIVTWVQEEMEKTSDVSEDLAQDERLECQ